MLKALTLALALALTGSGQDSAKSIQRDEERTLRLAPHYKPLAVVSDVFVSVHVLDEQLDKSGLPDALQTDVELRLRKAGIRVAAQPSSAWQTDTVIQVRKAGMKASDQDAGASATLNILVVGHKMNDRDVFPVFVAVSLVQPALTRREPSVLVDAQTWSSSYTIAMDRGNVDRRVRDEVSDKVDQFINAYLAANPR